MTAKLRKLQYLLVTELLDRGSVKLTLPDGILLEIGILQKDQLGKITKTDDYCYVVASREGKSAMLDSFNLGLQYEAEEDTILFEDETVSEDGQLVRTVDVI